MLQFPDSSFPLPLSAYSPTPNAALVEVLLARVREDPLNAVATTIFALAVIHTFVAARFTEAAHQVQHRHNAAATAAGVAPRPSVAAELLHFFGDVEVVFGLWVVPLLVAITVARGWETASEYLNSGVDFTEPLFVVVIMAIASTRPIVELAERGLRRVADLGGSTPAAWWVTVLIVAPLLGSFITEPGAMTIAAIVLSRQFFDLEPSRRLKYATLGLLFVNVSIGGTLTHFAAPPVLMVARAWGWDTAFMLTNFGWRAALAVPESVKPTEEAVRQGFGELAIPTWITGVYIAFLVWTVVNAHYPVLFLGGFLFFLGFDRATSAYSVLSDYRTPLLVGFFLGGLVIHGGLQAWWIGPVLGRLSETPLFLGATVLTAFNDNALITYLATLVPNLADTLKTAVVQGAVIGGGLTVIANAPNPAGQALLGRFFGGAIHPLHLFAAAIAPTLLAAAVFRLL
jgi:hypothetical protein